MPQVNLRIQFEVPRGYSVVSINGGLFRNVNLEFHKNFNTITVYWKTKFIIQFFI